MISGSDISDRPDGVAPRHCGMKALGTTIRLCAHLSETQTALRMRASKIWCFSRLLGAFGARHADDGGWETDWVI